MIDQSCKSKSQLIGRHSVENCPNSSDGLHKIVEAPEPWFCQCGLCGEKFFVMSESVAKALGFQLIPETLKTMH